MATSDYLLSKSVWTVLDFWVNLQTEWSNFSVPLSGQELSPKDKWRRLSWTHHLCINLWLNSFIRNCWSVRPLNMNDTQISISSALHQTSTIPRLHWRFQFSSGFHPVKFHPTASFSFPVLILIREQFPLQSYKAVFMILFVTVMRYLRFHILDVTINPLRQ